MGTRTARTATMGLNPAWFVGGAALKRSSTTTDMTSCRGSWLCGVIVIVRLVHACAKDGTACEACPPGETTSDENHYCFQCPSGRFTNATVNFTCTYCADGSQPTLVRIPSAGPRVRVIDSAPPPPPPSCQSKSKITIISRESSATASGEFDREFDSYSHVWSCSYHSICDTPVNPLTLWRHDTS